MKKVLALILAITMLFVMTACSGGIKTEYDDQGRVIKEANPDSDGGYFTYEYGENGLLTKKSEFAFYGTINSIFQIFGGPGSMGEENFVLKHVWYYEDGKISYSEELDYDGVRQKYFTYDDDGNKLRMFYCEEGQIIQGYYIQYSYFDNGEWQEEHFSDGKLSRRDKYYSDGKLISQEYFDPESGEVVSSEQYTYNQDGSYVTKVYRGNSESRYFYNSDNKHYKSEIYIDGVLDYSEYLTYDDKGNLTEREYHDANGLVSKEINTYNNNGEQTKRETYNAAEYLMEERLYEGTELITKTYSYTGTERWLWEKKTTGESSTITIYNASGDYVETSSDRTGVRIENNIAYTEYISEDGSVTIVIARDMDTNQSLSRTVTATKAYNANGQVIDCTQELLDSFNTLPEYPTK